MRSILTVLGITIGIAAVICVVAIGKAGQARVEQQLNNLGDNFVWIEAGLMKAKFQIGLNCRPMQHRQSRPPKRSCRFYRFAI